MTLGEKSFFLKWLWQKESKINPRKLRPAIVLMIVLSIIWEAYLMTAALFVLFVVMHFIIEWRFYKSKRVYDNYYRSQNNRKV